MSEVSDTQYIIEQNKPFSQSFLWQIDRTFYETHGIEAWSRRHVPFSITTSFTIARAYSRLILGFLHDNYHQLDKDQPLIILEIGAGSGRLAFNILRDLEALPLAEWFPSLSYRYVLSDLSEKNVAFWQSQPRLQSFVSKGVLDFARFDIGTDHVIHLVSSGERYTQGSLKNPMLIIANYVLDSLPVDLFCMEDNILYEVRGTFMSSEPTIDTSDPELINQLEIEYDRFPTTPMHYDDPQIAAILQTYLDSGLKGIFTFPLLALRSIQTLLTFSSGRMLLLTADKGDHHIAQIFSDTPPHIALHDGALSMQVNYHALAQLVQQQGGSVCITPLRYQYVDIMVCAWDIAHMTHLRQAYDDYVNTYNSNDVYVLVNNPIRESMDLEDLMAFIRLTGYDTHQFLTLVSRMLPQVESANDIAIDNLCMVADRVWDAYYDIGEPYNVPLYLANLLHKARAFEAALRYYAHAGDATETLCNMAVCHANLKQVPEALALLDRAAASTADHSKIDMLRKQIEALL